MSKITNNATRLTHNFISDSAKLGKNVKVWHFSYIGDNTTIGDNTKIGSQVHIDYDVKIGKNCKIEGMAYIPPGTVIGDNVFIGPGVIITNDRRPNMDLVQYKMSPVTIHDYAVICAGAMLRAGVTIHERACVGMGAVVINDVYKYETFVGTPQNRKKWIQV